jgi:uncharacterized protein with von Willebrand factor type A (vWA) domain
VFLSISAAIVFAQDSKKPSYGILLDNTGSMRTEIPREREIAHAIITRLAKDSRFSIFGFTTVSPRAILSLRLECSDSPTLLKAEVDKIDLVGGQTSLFDAVATAVDKLKDPTSANCDITTEQILIVLSDGADLASTITLQDLTARAKAAGVKVYAVGLIKKLGPGFVVKVPPSKAKENLVRLVKETGGRIVLPNAKDQPSEIVEELFSANYKFPK